MSDNNITLTYGATKYRSMYYLRDNEALYELQDEGKKQWQGENNLTAQTKNKSWRLPAENLFQLITF